MKARICDRCGGKLPSTDCQVVECEYCGTPFQMYEGPEVPEPQQNPRFVRGTFAMSAGLVDINTSTYCHASPYLGG